MKRAVVIIPTYNEKDNIERSVEAVLNQSIHVGNWRLEVLVVDDTSPDKTYELVGQMAKKNERIHLQVNKQKSGLGGAYLKGMNHAFNVMKADVVFEFDADLSHDPTKIPMFLEEIDDGADMVLGTRYKLGGSIPKNWGFHRKVLSRVANITVMIVLNNFKFRDFTSGYRAITKSVFEKVAPLLSNEQFSGYTFQIGFLYYANKAGFDIRETVPYAFADREIGQSKIGPEYIKNTLEFIFRMRLAELAENRIIKFALVGGLGALVQLLSLQIYRTIIPDENMAELAFFLSIETAIISNFIFNNAWTFKDKKLKTKDIPLKFITFNASSFGSIAIQMLIATVGIRVVGLTPIVTIPVLGVIDTGLVYAITGILLGMVWNFFAYSKFVWTKK